MFNNIKLLDTMSAMAGHAAERHAVIANNVANADTPNFKAQDIQPFSEIFDTSLREQQNIKSLQAQVVQMDAGDISSPNGNTVSLEQQMMLATETKANHDMALAIYKKSLDMMKLAIGKNI